jgi:hypothetical protein
MAIELSDVTNALQKVIMPYIRDNFPKQTILLDQVKRNKGVTFMNNYFYAPLRTSRHGGVTNLANDGNALVTGKASLGQAYVGVKILTGTFDISKLAIDATKTAKGAVESQLTFQASTLASDFARSVNRQYFQDGSGIVSQVASSAAATKVTVKLPDTSCDDGAAKDRYGTINGDIDPLKYLHPGAFVAVGTAAAAKGTVSTVESDGSGGGTITFTGTTASVANDAIGFTDGSNEGFGTMEINGLGDALSSSTGTSTYANVARSTYGWTPQFGSTSESLTLSAMEDKYLAAKEYSQMGDQYAIFVNKTLFKKYGDLLTSMRRSVEKTDLLGGWTGLEFAAGSGKVGVFLDYDVPDGECLIVNLDSLTICQVSDLDWLDAPNENALTRRPDYITYQATMAWFTNLLCLCPAANGRLTQKTD